jgi:holliday junction DNA helicase RuvA
MIVSVRGRVTDADTEKVVIEAGGLGYGLLVPGRLASALSRRVGDEVLVHTYLHVRDDALQLFGFESPRERRFFVTLIGVNGVGPKVALAILSAYSVSDLETAVVRGDHKRFESISGIGNKLAQRLVLELKDKVGVALDTAPALPEGAAAGPDPFLQARVALQNLGLPLRDAEAALQGAPDDASLEELVRYALTKKAPA